MMTINLFEAFRNAKENAESSTVEAEYRRLLAKLSAHDMVLISRAIHAAAPTPEQPAGEQWQPISTAPRDGALVMFFFPNSDMRINRADDYWNKAIWLESATHWMPLPQPPTGEAKS